MRIPPIFQPGINLSDNHNNDTVSTVMADIMNRVSLSDNSGNEGCPSRSTPSPKAKISGMECAACLEHDDTGSLLWARVATAFAVIVTRNCLPGQLKMRSYILPAPVVILRHMKVPWDFWIIVNSTTSARDIEDPMNDRVYCTEPTCSKFTPSPNWKWTWNVPSMLSDNAFTLPFSCTSWGWLPNGW